MQRIIIPLPGLTYLLIILLAHIHYNDAEVKLSLSYSGYASEDRVSDYLRANCQFNDSSVSDLISMINQIAQAKNKKKPWLELPATLSLTNFIFMKSYFTKSFDKSYFFILRYPYLSEDIAIFFKRYKQPSKEAMSKLDLLLGQIKSMQSAYERSIMTASLSTMPMTAYHQKDKDATYSYNYWLAEFKKVFHDRFRINLVTCTASLFRNFQRKIPWKEKVIP